VPPPRATLSHLSLDPIALRPLRPVTARDTSHRASMHAPPGMPRRPHELLPTLSCTRHISRYANTKRPKPQPPKSLWSCGAVKPLACTAREPPGPCSLYRPPKRPRKPTNVHRADQPLHLPPALSAVDAAAEPPTWPAISHTHSIRHPLASRLPPVHGAPNTTRRRL